MIRKISKGTVISIVSALVILAIAIGCSSDIILKPLPSLIGDYQGRYLVTTNYGSTNASTKEYRITWRFTDQKYYMYDDDPAQEFCVPSGNYTLSGSDATLDQLIDGCAGVVGNPEYNPTGTFQLRQPGDSVVLAQISGTPATQKQLLLVKTTK
jgi:hypothetical protein